MRINLFSLFPFLSALIIIFLSILVYKKRSRSPINQAFSLFTFFSSIWLFNYAISYTTITEQQALFWLKIGYTGVILIPVGFYHFIYAFLNLKSRIYKIYLIFAYGMSLIFIYLLWGTNYFVNGVYKFFWGYYPSAGSLHPFYMGFLFLTVSPCFVLLFMSWLKERKEPLFQKLRLQYIFLAYVIAFLACIDFIPNYGIEIYPFGWIFAVFYSVIIAYAILRYRLMDIYVYVKKTTAYSLAVGMLTALFVVVVLTLTRYVTNLTRLSSFTITVVAAILIALLFNPLRNRIQVIIDRLFYKKTYDFYAVVQKTSQELSNKLSLKDIYNFVGESIFTTLGLSSLYLLSASVGGYYRVVYKRPLKGETEKGRNGVNPELYASKVRIGKDSALTKLLNKTKNILICEILNEEDIKEEELEEIKKNLEPFKAGVIVPIFVDDKLSHIMILGRKISGDIFSLEDINLLNTLSNQISIAIKQSQLYSEKILSEKLSSIGMMSATFAHEIRNPLTSLRTFTQLMPERYYDPDFRETFRRVVLFDIERIEDLMKDLLDFSSAGRPRGTDKFNLTRLIDETVDYIEKKFELQKSKISVEKNYKNIEINMKGDINRLKHAFINVMSNACQAMHERGVLTVSIVPDGRNVNISISDTGEGINPEDIDNIFEPFYTTKEKGMGLGLAISKKSIEDHGGSIRVESGLEGGTTFVITLPR